MGMGYHHEVLMDSLMKFAAAGVDVKEMAFLEREYLAIAHDCRIHDPNARIRAALIRKPFFAADASVRDEIVNVQAPDSFRLMGPNGGVLIRNVDAVPFVPLSQRMDSLTDDQLRAECEWRGMTVFNESNLDTCEVLTKAKHNRLTESLTTERDEWKARAEKAEATLVDDGDLVPLGSFHDCGRIELLVTRVDNERLFSEIEPNRVTVASDCGCFDAARENARLKRGVGEHGPGIARLPPPQSEPLAHDDTDLLADDATPADYERLKRPACRS